MDNNSSSDNSSGSVKAWLIPMSAISIVLVFFLLAIANWNNLLSGRAIQSTDNATIKKDITLLNAKVSGYVKDIYVSDFQRVNKGDLIAIIDERDYQANVTEARAQQASAQATLDSLDKEERLQQSAIDKAEAEQQSIRAKASLAKLEEQRYRKLQVTEAISRHELDISTYNLLAYQAQLRQATASIESEKHKLSVLQAERRTRAANVAMAKAQQEKAEISLNYTRIYAPFDGEVGQRRVYPGSLVSVGTQIISVVPDNPPYIIANYKETQLRRVQDNQQVTITIDAFPGELFRGEITHIAPASGSEYALIPSDNATGNFTKVVQRVPVRIDFLPRQPLVNHLVSGMSVITHIDTESLGVK